MISKPRFIALEGIDGAGTTTQSRLLVDWLRSLGRPVHLTREPSDGPIGLLIREVLRGDHGEFDPSAIALLFAADRLDHLSREIRPALARGRDVVSDRYVLSSLAYQGLDGNLPWVETLNARAEPAALTIVLDVPVDVCLARLEQRGLEPELYERRETLNRVDHTYRALIERMDPGGEIAFIDGTPDPEAVARAIRDVVTALLGIA